MKYTLYFLIFFLVTIFLAACDKEPQNQSAVEEIEKDTEPGVEKDDQMTKMERELINNNSFMGFTIDEKFDQRSKNLRAKIKKDGENSFYGYAILDERGNEIGFVHPWDHAADRVRMIEVHAEGYYTIRDIGVGHTYEQLKKVYPDVETHGSEIESRTTSRVDNLLFILDAAFDTYDIDESKIKPDTRIKQINIVNR